MNDIPKTVVTNSQFNAHIGNYLSFGSYLSSYKQAFDVLMNNVYDSNFHVDRLAYPILFIARHCMELGFKTNIRYFIKYSEKDDFRKAGTHDLENLFAAFKLHVLATIKNLKDKYNIDVEEVDKKEFNNYCNEVERLTATLHSLDRGSDSFRYPVDKNNNNSFEQNQTINLLEVKKLYDQSMILLTYTADVFSKYTDFADEINSIYEREMIEQFGIY